MAETPRAYIMLTGPYRNIGDSLIRRRALEWARDFGAPVVLIAGDRAPDWDESLGLATTDRVTRSRRAWLGEVLRAPVKSVLVIEPGEFNTDSRFYLSLVYLAVASAVIRVKRGRVVQMPRSLAKRSKIGDLIYRATVARGHLLWREGTSAAHFQWGQVVPDIGFDDWNTGANHDERRALAVSLRGDRPMPGEEWMLGVASFAREAGLHIVSLAQVEGDNDRAERLAHALGGEADLWVASVSSVERERDVRRLYGRCRIVISDRLHALVIGAVCGAVPIEIVPDPSGKVRKHFSVIGLQGVSHDTNVLSPDDVLQLLRAAAAGATEVTERVSSAADQLRETRGAARGSLGNRGRV